MTPEERSHAAEVVCEWMADQFTDGENCESLWNFSELEEITLDALHLVEEMLSDEQRKRYIDMLCKGRSLNGMLRWQQFDYADARGAISSTPTPTPSYWHWHGRLRKHDEYPSHSQA